jgi:hypothetical protein
MGLVKVADDRFAALLLIEATVMRYGWALNDSDATEVIGNPALSELRQAGDAVRQLAKQIAKYRKKGT